MEVHSGGQVIRQRLGEGSWEHYTTKARFFFDEVKHELSADALVGRGGSLDGTVVAHLGPEYIRHRSALFFVEASIEQGAVVVVQ